MAVKGLYARQICPHLVRSDGTAPTDGPSECAACRQARVDAEKKAVGGRITPAEWASLSGIDMLRRLREEGARSCVTREEVSRCAYAIVSLQTHFRGGNADVWNFHISTARSFAVKTANVELSVANAADFAYEVAMQVAQAGAPDLAIRYVVESLWSEDKMLSRMDQEEARLYLIGAAGRGGRLDTCEPEDYDRLMAWAVKLDDPESWADAEKNPNRSLTRAL